MAGDEEWKGEEDGEEETEVAVGEDDLAGAVHRHGGWDRAGDGIITAYGDGISQSCPSSVCAEIDETKLSTGKAKVTRKGNIGCREPSEGLSIVTC